MLKLIIQDLKQQKLRTFLAIASVAIASTAIILSLGLQKGITTATFNEISEKTPLTQITVRPNLDNNSILNFALNNNNHKLSNQTIKDIQQIKGVKAIHPEIQFKSFASVEGTVLGLSLITDTIIYGVNEDFIKDDIQKQTTWEYSKSEPIPAIIPRKLLDLYNVTIAYPQNLPTIKESSLLGKKLTLFPNHSTFFPVKSDTKDEIQLEVVGFSSKINLLGITIPYNRAQELNVKYQNTIANTYIQLYVETESEDITEKVATQIESLDLKTTYLQKNLKQIEGKMKFISIILFIITIIIISTSILAIISTYLGTITERKKEIGLLRALGATKKQIKNQIITQASITGTSGAIIGIILGIFISKIIDIITIPELQTLAYKQDTIFKITSTQITTTLTIGILISISAAYIPAKQASNISPVNALK